MNELDESSRLIDESVALWRELNDPVGLGSALRWRSRVRWLFGDRERAVADADEAVVVLEASGPTADLAWAYSTQSQLAMLSWDFDGSLACASRAEATARAVAAPGVLAHALVNRGTSLAMSHYPSQTDVLAEAIDLAAASKSHDEVIRGRVNWAWSALLWRDLPAAEKHARDTIAICDTIDQLAFEQYASGTLALVRLMQGGWYEAEDLVRPLVALDHVWATSGILFRTVLGILQTRRGDPEAASVLAEAWDIAVATRELQRTAPVAAAMAQQAWITGDSDGLREVVDPQIEMVSDTGLDWIAAELWFWASKAGLAVRMPAELPEPYLLAHRGDWAGSAAAWERLGMPYERAIALSDGDDAARIDAVTILDGLGAVPVASRFRTELRARGVEGVPRPPSRATRAHPAGLTPRQSEVVELLAIGLSNPEIADRLFVSPRTVDHHVSAILAKLGVTTRAEAVEAAVELGVVSPT